jgi:hypothetical protein
VLGATVAVAISMGFTTETRGGLSNGGVAAVLIVTAYAAKQRRSHRETCVAVDVTALQVNEARPVVDLAPKRSR